MDERTRRRHERLKVAERIAERLNARDAEDKDARRVAALVARPELLGARERGTGGYLRRTITARRTSGERLTLYFHGRSRTLRVKVESCEPAREQRPLLLDEIRHYSGLIASCEGCARFYVKTDQRMTFCSKTCAARRRQRRHRARSPEALAAAAATWARLEAAKAR